jgi:translation initiation factor IF-2
MALQHRPPVITIMGHVDHGKTTLLDYIRKTKVAAREAGGITQHIGAYQVSHQGKLLTFIDTPGHAAFNKMRERGAKVTDIVVLVVAANDGVKPQTSESIRHIKESKASVVVAINKSDLEGVYPDMVKAQLAEEGILVNGFGGSVDAIEVSAKTGKGVDKLLETLVVMAELDDLKADPTAPLEAVVIESTKDPRRGTVASVIVQQGTLQIRQDLIGEGVAGRVRQLSDENAQSLQQVLPGSPAEIIGLDSVPPVGSYIRDAAEDYPEEAELMSDSNSNPFDDVSNNSLAALLNEQDKLKLILKADAQGTLEAIRQNLDPESVELLSEGLGQVVEQDVEMAETTGAVIISFHTKVPKNIKELA